MSTYALQHFISGGKIASHLSLNVVEIGIYRDFCFTFDKKKREQNRFIRFRFFSSLSIPFVWSFVEQQTIMTQIDDKMHISV